MPHPQHLHVTPIPYVLGKKTTANIREFGRQICLWEFEGVKKYIYTHTYVYTYMVLAHSYNLDLQISILELWTLSFPPSLLLFQALILCEEFFSTSVHMYISFLHGRMSVDIS